MNKKQFKKHFKPAFYIGQPVLVMSYVEPEYIDNERQLLVYPHSAPHYPLGIVVGAKLIHLGLYHPGATEGDHWGPKGDHWGPNDTPPYLEVTQVIHLYEVRLGWINRPLLCRLEDVIGLRDKDWEEVTIPYRYTRYINR